MIAVHSQAPGRQFTSLKRGNTLPRESWSMKRATRVPASTAVRMNSASNMMAKWYQKPIRDSPPTSLPMIRDSPTASVGAPPVRETTVSSPTRSARWVRSPGVRFTPARPRPMTKSTAVSGVPPVRAAGAFMAKYTPRSIVMAATSAMTATKASMSMPP